MYNDIVMEFYRTKSIPFNQIENTYYDIICYYYDNCSYCEHRANYVHYR